MTILVGFECVDGIVLATDSKISVGDEWHSDEKIELIELNEEAASLCIALAITGRPELFRFVVEQLRDELASDMGLAEARATIQRVIERIYCDHVYKDPDPKQQARFGLLLGLRAHDGHALLATASTAVSGGKIVQTLGSGLSAARRAIAGHSTKGLTVAHAATMAVEATMRASETVKSCGGKTVVVVMYSPGKIGFMPATAIERRERFIAAVGKKTNRTMLAGMNPAMTNQEFAEKAKRLANELAELRVQSEIVKDDSATIQGSLVSIVSSRPEDGGIEPRSV